jgi:hypothetical protein
VELASEEVHANQAGTCIVEWFAITRDGSIAPNSMTPKTLLGLSTVMLVFAAVFGLLNVARVKGLETNLATTAAARDTAEQRRSQQEERLLARRSTTSPSPGASGAETETKAAKAEADLAQVLKEKADLQNKLQASQAEITSLQNRLQEPSPSVEASSANPGAASAAELQAQLDDTRRQLESAERENAFLSEKLASGSTQRLATAERAGSSRERSSAPSSIQTKRREPTGPPVKGSANGTVLAVNQAYNFVVLNLGKRQGLQANADMVVYRGGTRIGKLRISSVEPATAIGDIMTNSLARGVQVQPGDTVVYAGSHF